MLKFAKQKRTTGILALDRKLWRIFSEYIRRRDADQDGICRCITCRKPKPWKEMDAGHFVNRARKSTKFDERNVHAQCPVCNRFAEGKQFLYGNALDLKLGHGTAQKLIDLGGMHSKLDRLWYEERIKYYREKLKGMK